MQKSNWKNKIKYIPTIILSIIFIVLLIKYANKLINNNALQTQQETISHKKEQKLKTILYWTKYFFGQPDFHFGFGHEPFVEKCEINNCYVTNNSSYQNVENFDAILMHGALFFPNFLPSTRSPEQYYVLLNHECPRKFPGFKGFPNLINLTMTYRLDSDIFVPYLKYYDSEDKYVAPKLIPQWVSPLHDEDYLEQFMDLYERKSKPVAWFASNCKAFYNRRTEYVKELEKYLSVDIYGKCGTLNCTHDGEMSCYNLLKKDYFFYLSFENSNCVDYVSEKLFVALENELIPIVMNGADMSRMAPPYSYIDARKYEPKELAEYLKFLMANPMEYLKYHWWRKTYYVTGCRTSHRLEDPLCSLCKFLNMPHTEHRSYADFHAWYAGSLGNSICDSKILKNSDYIPSDDPDEAFEVINHELGVNI